MGTVIPSVISGKNRIPTVEVFLGVVVGVASSVVVVLLVMEMVVVFMMLVGFRVSFSFS